MKKYYWLVWLVVLVLLLPVSGHAEKDFLNKLSDKPMQVTSDRMEVFKDKRTVIFSGNARVAQGNSELKSDKLILYYKGALDHKGKSDNIPHEKSGDLEKIEAKGNVYLNHDQKVATGDEAVYLRDSDKITMTGNATLREGKNIIKGERVVVFLKENRGMVEGNSQKQVKAVFFPKDVKKTEKK